MFLILKSRLILFITTNELSSTKIFRGVTGGNMLVISKDEDAIKDHSGKTKAYSLPDRKSVKRQVAPFGTFQEGRIS